MLIEFHFCGKISLENTLHILNYFINTTEHFRAALGLSWKIGMIWMCTGSVDHGFTFGTNTRTGCDSDKCLQQHYRHAGHAETTAYDNNSHLVSNYLSLLVLSWKTFLWFFAICKANIFQRLLLISFWPCQVTECYFSIREVPSWT